MFSVPKMTLKDIRDEVNRITDDIWDNADLNAWANQCLDDLTDVVKYEKTIMLNLEDSSREYELPEDFHDSVGLTNVYGAELEYSIEGNGTKLRVLSPFIGEAQFTYVAHLPKLVSPDDVPALPVPFQHIIAIYCAMKAMQMDGRRTSYTTRNRHHPLRGRIYAEQPHLPRERSAHRFG